MLTDNAWTHAAPARSHDLCGRLRAFGAPALSIPIKGTGFSARVAHAARRSATPRERRVRLAPKIVRSTPLGEVSQTAPKTSGPHGDVVSDRCGLVAVRRHGSVF